MGNVPYKPNCPYCGNLGVYHISPNLPIQALEEIGIIPLFKSSILPYYWCESCNKKLKKNIPGQQYRKDGFIRYKANLTYPDKSLPN